MANLTAAERAFWELRADDGTGLRTSSGVLFNHTVFARDVSMIARWILPLGKDFQEVSREVILTLCWHQGVATRPQAEEQPGRIHNEYRKFAVWKAPATAKAMGRLLSLLWGGNLQDYTTYIAVDTTPLFIQLVCAYAGQIDRGILEETVVRRDGRQTSVRQCLDEAVAWIVNHRDKHGLISDNRSNPFSLFYQIWKDSHTALIHTHHRLASLSRPVAYLETQFLAVDALRAAAELLDHDCPTQAKVWQKMARELVETTLERFWDRRENRFYVALDHDRHGRLRPITTPGSSPGWMLDSTFFDQLPREQSQSYIEAITRQLLGAAFVTPAGIRSRAVGVDNWLKVADYHGSHTVWPVDSYVFARGLRRQGLPQLAHGLEQRILRAVDHAGSFYEYFLVTTDGRVLYEPHKALDQRRELGYRLLPRQPIQILPERQLAWTISICLLLQHGTAPTSAGSDWTRTLQTELAPNLLEPEPLDTNPPFVPAPYRGAWRVAQVATGQWVREYILRR